MLKFLKTPEGPKSSTNTKDVKDIKEVDYINMEKDLFDQKEETYIHMLFTTIEEAKWNVIDDSLVSNCISSISNKDSQSKSSLNNNF